MSERARRILVEQLTRVVAWELEAQLGVERAVEEIPGHIADTLLDHFDITPKPGVPFVFVESP